MIRSLRGHKSNFKSLILMTSLVIPFLLKSHQCVVFFHPPLIDHFCPVDGLTLFVQCLRSEVSRGWQSCCSVSSWPCRIAITWSLQCYTSAHHKHSTPESESFFPASQVTWVNPRSWEALASRPHPGKTSRESRDSVSMFCKRFITITWDRSK